MRAGVLDPGDLGDSCGLPEALSTHRTRIFIASHFPGTLPLIPSASRVSGLLSSRLFPHLVFLSHPRSGILMRETIGCGGFNTAMHK